MSHVLENLFFIVAGLILLVLALKVVVLKSGKHIKTDFTSFFWFSKMQISNSSYSFSKRKRIQMNQLSLILLFLLGLEVIICTSFFWINL